MHGRFQCEEVNHFDSLRFATDSKSTISAAMQQTFKVLLTFNYSKWLSTGL